ncbi:hypothetical protein [Paraburkholderia youngii]|uniref:hypothetical protein n=1 Tax=Paraburkholderia youngii TaxID=2782701 RepID=UPI003D2543DF
MNSVEKAERLPRWKDVLVFGVTGLTLLFVFWASHGVHAALWFAKRWVPLTALLAVVTAIRQHKRATKRPA